MQDLMRNGNEMVPILDPTLQLQVDSTYSISIERACNPDANICGTRKYCKYGRQAKALQHALRYIRNPTDIEQTSYDVPKRPNGA